MDERWLMIAILVGGWFVFLLLHYALFGINLFDWGNEKKKKKKN